MSNLNNFCSYAETRILDKVKGFDRVETLPLFLLSRIREYLQISNIAPYANGNVSDAVNYMSIRASKEVLNRCAFIPNECKFRIHERFVTKCTLPNFNDFGSFFNSMIRNIETMNMDELLDHISVYLMFGGVPRFNKHPSGHFNTILNGYMFKIRSLKVDPTNMNEVATDVYQAKDLLIRLHKDINEYVKSVPTGDWIDIVANKMTAVSALVLISYWKYFKINGQSYPDVTAGWNPYQLLGFEG